MFKIKDKIRFKHSENLMKQEGDVMRSVNDIDKNKNLYFLLKERFLWMNDFPLLMLVVLKLVRQPDFQKNL